MKTYEVLCKTCNGVGFIPNPELVGPGTTSTTPLTIICLVCKGSKTQTVHETESS